MNKSFSSKVFYQIICKLMQDGFEVEDTTHLGDDTFEIAISKDKAPMSGWGETAVFKVVENDVIKVETLHTWMS